MYFLLMSQDSPMTKNSAKEGNLFDEIIVKRTLFAYLMLPLFLSYASLC